MVILFGTNIVNRILMLYFCHMKYPKVLKSIFYKLLQFYYAQTGIARQKVLIKSMRSVTEHDGVKMPQREFFALTKRNKEMAWGSVTVGRFQDYKYQYCIFNGTLVKPWYRRRYLAAKLVQARLIFCEKQNFENVIVPVESDNIASIAMLKKCGFQFLDKAEWSSWMNAEVEYLKGRDLLLGLYRIKKPVQ